MTWTICGSCKLKNTGHRVIFHRLTNVSEKVVTHHEVCHSYLDFAHIVVIIQEKHSLTASVGQTIGIIGECFAVDIIIVILELLLYLSFKARSTWLHTSSQVVDNSMLQLVHSYRILRWKPKGKFGLGVLARSTAFPSACRSQTKPSGSGTLTRMQ